MEASDSTETTDSMEAAQQPQHPAVPVATSSLRSAGEADLERLALMVHVVLERFTALDSDPGPKPV